MTYEIIVQGEPVPKARVRVTKTGHAYTPQKTRDAENKIAFTWVAKYGRKKTSEPVAIEILFALKKPKQGASRRVQKRPDIDNLVKTVLDALNGVAYDDDKQVFKLQAIKRWSEGMPYTRVWIREDAGE